MNEVQTLSVVAILWSLLKAVESGYKVYSMEKGKNRLIYKHEE